MTTDCPVHEPSALIDVTSESQEALHFDYPVSDIVLHSCDSHNFHVSKLYIANSSLYFENSSYRVFLTLPAARAVKNKYHSL